MSGITDLSNWANIVPVNNQGGYFDTGIIGDANGFFRLDNEINHLRAYNECSPLKSIISKRSKAFNNGIISIVDDKGNESKSKSAVDMLAKLYNPNPIQTGRQFLAQQNTYIDIFGWCLVLKTKPVGFSSITNLWNIPTWMLDPVYTYNWLYETKIEGIIQNFKFSFGGSVIELQPGDFSLIFDDGFGTENNFNMLIPDSRLRGNEFPVSTIIACYKASNTIITKKGAIGILSNKSTDAGSTLPLQPSEKNALQQEFKRYGITGQEYQIIVSESNLEWNAMGMNVAEMQILEIKADAVMALCDSYGYPYRLLAQEKSASYNDVSEFRKDFYSDTIIPESASRWEQRTAMLLEGTGLRFLCDFSKLPALQDDKQKSATARKTEVEGVEKAFKNNYITLDRSRELMGEIPVNDKFGKMYYYELIAAGWQFGNTGRQSGDTNSTTPPNVGKVA